MRLEIIVCYALIVCYPTALWLSCIWELRSLLWVLKDWNQSLGQTVCSHPEKSEMKFTLKSLEIVFRIQFFPCGIEIINFLLAVTRTSLSIHWVFACDPLPMLQSARVRHVPNSSSRASNQRCGSAFKRLCGCRSAPLGKFPMWSDSCKSPFVLQYNFERNISE